MYVLDTMAVERGPGVDSSLLGLGWLWRSRAGFVVVVAATVAVLVGLRLAYGTVVGDDLQAVTVFALAGGLLGGTVMAAVIGFGVDVDRSQYATLRLVQWAHVTYAAVAAAVFPRLYWVMDGTGAFYTAFPDVLHAAHTYSIVMFAVAALAYVATGAITGARDNLRPWVGMMGLYLVYGVVLGLWMGLAWGAWKAVV